MLRSHTCGQLRASDADSEVSLCGWVSRVRAHGGVTFVDLRDRYGVMQLVFEEDVSFSRDSVLRVEGVVQERPSPNDELETGAVEVHVSSHSVLSAADPLPLEENAGEETRLRYRYLDLRRDEMQERLLFRSRVSQLAREFLLDEEFVEVETPLLMKSTPEGARDYVVPSRVNKGRFYALPQSPQLYKQILMVAGLDRYFQLPRCLRDEDLRQDRQPEHTQIDCEMSFVDVEDLLSMWEGLMAYLFEEALGVELETPFTRIPYVEAMERYGTDKPDLRFGLELATVTELAHQTDFRVFTGASTVRALAVSHAFSRSEIDDLTAFVQGVGAKGLAWTTVSDDGLEGGVAKFLGGIAQDLVEALGASVGDTLFFVADTKRVADEALGRLRKRLGHELGLVDDDEFAFCFVTDFPLFERDEEADAWVPAHHLFCKPVAEDIPNVLADPGSVRCTQYDLVLNGVELGSGSLRITDPDLQKKVLSVVGIAEEAAEEKFGFLLEAFRYGAPPHGGIGIGFDRLVAMMRGLTDIREVIAFPKNKQAQNPLDGSPAPISEEQLGELGLSLEETS